MLQFTSAVSTEKVAKYGSLSFSDEDKTKIVELIMERDSLQDKDDLKLKIKQSIKVWAYIFLPLTRIEHPRIGRTETGSWTNRFWSLNNPG